jgi:hypothetical protein
VRENRAAPIGYFEPKNVLVRALQRVVVVALDEHSADAGTFAV